MQEPLLRHTYITSRVLNSAGVEACEEVHEKATSEFALGHQSSLAEWLGDGIQHCDVDTVQKTVVVDLVRVLRELVPVTRIRKVKCRVLRSTEMR